MSNNIKKLEDNEELYEKLRSLFTEHFDHFCFIVMDEDGDLYYDYNNVRIGRMLINETRKEMEAEIEDCEAIWFDDEEEE